MRYQSDFGRCNPDTGEMTFPADTRPSTIKEMLLVLCGALPFALCISWCLLSVNVTHPVVITAAVILLAPIWAITFACLIWLPGASARVAAWDNRQMVYRARQAAADARHRAIDQQHQRWLDKCRGTPT